MTKILTLIGEETLDFLNVEEICKDFKLKIGDLMRMSLYYHNFLNRSQNEDSNINIISKTLGMSEKNIRKLFLKGKKETIQKYFITKLFNKKIFINVNGKYEPVDLNEFTATIEYSLEKSVQEYSKENLEEIVDNDILTSVTILAIIYATESTNLSEMSNDYISILNDKEKYDSIVDIVIQFFTSFVTDINKFIYNRNMKVECEVDEQLEVTIQLIEEQKKKYEDELKKATDLILEYKEENDMLREKLEEALEVIEKFSYDQSNKLTDKKILVIGDQGRSREYYEQLKKFGLKEKNYFHLDGMYEAQKAKNYKNRVDVVIQFISQSKHKADRQLDDFPETTQIIKLNRTGLFQLYEGIRQIHA